jgi:O-antigen ligase
LVPPPILRKLSLWLAIACCVSILVSIAVSQILLAIALGVLLLSGLPLRWPRIAIPLALFLGWTLVSLAFSPDPGLGLPQVRKMLVFAMLPIVYSSIRTFAEAKWLVVAWIVAGTVTAGRGLVQFAGDVARYEASGAGAAHTDFYHFYVADRIRGFMSHWMTFSGQELFVLLLAAACLLFGPNVKKRLWLWLPCAAVIGVALVLSQTRSVWIAAVAAGFYLLWEWNKRAAMAMPVVVGLGLLVAPAAIQQRARSIVQPQTQTDSNQHRIVCWRTGWQMIKAHPIVGVGPEEIGKRDLFDSYVPADIHWPLPDGWYGHLHNIYIHYAAERGIPASLLLTAALLLTLHDFRRVARSLPAGRSDRRMLLEAAIACVIGTMVSGVFELNLGDSEVLTMFLAIVCLGYLAADPPKPANLSPTG